MSGRLAHKAASTVVAVTWPLSSDMKRRKRLRKRKMIGVIFDGTTEARAGLAVSPSDRLGSLVWAGVAFRNASTDRAHRENVPTLALAASPFSLRCTNLCTERRLHDTLRWVLDQCRWLVSLAEAHAVAPAAPVAYRYDSSAKGCALHVTTKKRTRNAVLQPGARRAPRRRRDST